ncbi:MAG: sodium:solute symporter [Cyclobacteriaceae bacterium]|nr:sodium:solute symporter [Cyclobacteriaceae bacterium]
MSTLDLIVLFGTLGFIVVYGAWKTKGSKNIQGYLLGDNSMKWATIGLSVMATQASAITFLSTPGYAFENGMEFVQNYFGLPIALIVVSAVFIPIFYRLKVYTAYEYLEKRFDLKARLLGAFLFLLHRSLAAGITIYAPAIILSTILGWSLSFTILLVGILVIIYTVTGGTKAVSLTQKYQMGVIMLGMFIAFFLIIDYFPEEISFMDSVRIAGKLGKLEAVDFSLDFSKRYTFWSGITGGLFLSLSYFGTDQSQVARYLTGKNVTESRMGLMFNALLKIPMQFFILFVGVMVFIFYQFEQPPVYFKGPAVENVLMQDHPEAYRSLQKQHSETFRQKRSVLFELNQALENENIRQVERKSTEVRELQEQSLIIKNEVKGLLLKSDPGYDTRDSDYVFITFIMNYLPRGIIGLLLAVIFSAAMSSTSSELNALGSTTTVDFYQRLFKSRGSEGHILTVSKILTAVWGGIAILFAFIANQAENLIEAVNIVGSLFYGTILGIFIAAFFIRSIKATSIFMGAIIAEILILLLHLLNILGFVDIGYLWYNVIGFMITILMGWLISMILKK